MLLGIMTFLAGCRVWCSQNWFPLRLLNKRIDVIWNLSQWWPLYEDWLTLSLILAFHFTPLFEINLWQCGQSTSICKLLSVLWDILYISWLVLYHPKLCWKHESRALNTEGKKVRGSVDNFHFHYCHHHHHHQ